MSPAAALAEAHRLLPSDPARAEALCRGVLANADDASARLLLAAALRLQGDWAGALDHAEAMARRHPEWAGAHFERGLALAKLDRRAEALAAYEAAARLGGAPGLWRETGDLLWDNGDRAGAEAAYLRHLASAPEPLVHEALSAQRRGDREAAERALRLHLTQHRWDVLALRLLAELLSAATRYEEAASLLRRCLERAPSFGLARFGLAMVLFHDHAYPAALEQVERLLSREPGRLDLLLLKADILGRLGDFDAARAVLDQIIAARPAEGAAWQIYGDVLRALGRRADCEAAYKKAIALGPRVGEAYWGLANLKTFRFEPADVEAMRTLAQRTGDGESNTCLLFALAKALEDQGGYADAFAVLAKANASRRARLPHDPKKQQEVVRGARRLFTEGFFAERRGMGCAAADPIFIVGMPRSGSTLVEQILASHSLVEGTMELVDLMLIAERLGTAYPEMLAEKSAEDLAQLGDTYLERTRAYRKTDAPFFIDKMPNNFAHVGLIHLILPNARIIDVRRHPLACGVSIYKQHWATGQSFAYDLADIGAEYRGYVELMTHFDRVLPGRVHRVIYEELVADPELETRRLLEACGLQFEDACLRFYENKRMVRTPSSEQVRQPIFSSGLESWRPYEARLGPLKEALGPVLESYPAPPEEI